MSTAIPRGHRDRMLPLALIFFAAAAIAAVLGYTTAVGVTLAPARVLFFVFLACTLMALISAALRLRHGIH